MPITCITYVNFLETCLGICDGCFTTGPLLPTFWSLGNDLWILNGISCYSETLKGHYCRFSLSRWKKKLSYVNFKCKDMVIKIEGRVNLVSRSHVAKAGQMYFPFSDRLLGRRDKSSCSKWMFKLAALCDSEFEIFRYITFSQISGIRLPHFFTYPLHHQSWGSTL